MAQGGSSAPKKVEAASSEAPLVRTDHRSSLPVPMGGLIMQTSNWGQLAVEMMEHVPQLTWPASVRTFHAMRNDSQIDALLTGVILPAMRMGWSIKPNGARDEVVEKVSRDYNIPIQGEESDEDDDGLDFGEFLYHALLALAYGHMFFDMAGTVESGGGLWHIDRLAPLMPQTLSAINVNDDGTLHSVQQIANGPVDAPPFPEARLVPYVWAKEGSNWVGRSMLRPLYRDWFVKDRVIRVNAMNLEVAGRGTPVFEAPQGASQELIEALDEMARSWKAGEEAGGAVPFGVKPRLVGVEGSQPDAIRTINYHDEAMARSFLAMFVQLGQTKTGSRALGAEFADMMNISLEAVAGWFQKIFNRVIIKRDIVWNYGEDEKRPKLVYETFENPNLAVADLNALIDSGAIVVDTPFRLHIRKKYRLPEEDTEEIEENQRKMAKLLKQESDARKDGGSEASPDSEEDDSDED